MYLIAFPLLLIPFVLYNMVAFLLNLEFNTTLFTVQLLSGVRMAISTGDMLIVFSIFLLYLEILKATRLSTKAVMDHVLSAILFIAMAVELAIVDRAATSTFLILAALSLVDVIGGFTITIRTAQRDIAPDQPDQIASQS
jgi:hypothetical protein